MVTLQGIARTFKQDEQLKHNVHHAWEFMGCAIIATVIIAEIYITSGGICHTPLFPKNNFKYVKIRPNLMISA